MTKKIFFKISIILLTVFILCISFYFLWSNGTFLPHWIEWENKTFSGKSGKYEIHLSNKTVHINYGGALIWSTAQGIKVPVAPIDRLMNKIVAEDYKGYVGIFFCKTPGIPYPTGWFR